MFLALPWIFGAVLVGFLGKERSCGFIRGFLLSLFLSPIIAGIMVLLCPRKKSVAQMLAEAKIYLDSGAATQEEYEQMVADITTKGFLKDLKKYKKGIINPFQH